MRRSLIKPIGNILSRSGTLKSLLIISILVTTLSYAGCSDDPPRSGETYIIFDEQAFLTEISESDTLIDLFRIKRDFEATREKSSPVSEALESKIKTFLERQQAIGTLSEEVDLVTADYVQTGPYSWRLDYLFKVNRAFQDDYNILLRAYVEPEDRDRLTSEAHQEGGYELWGFAPEPPTSEWPVGEHVLIHRPLPAAQLIPYRFVSGFYKPGAGVYGMEVDLGWYRPQPVTEEELLEAIGEAEDVFDLARISKLHAGRSQWTEPVSAAFDSAWEKLGKEAEPNQPFSEGVDLIAFEFRRTADETYRLTYLFDVRKEMEKDYRIYVHGYVDSNHLHFLPEERRELKFDNWTFSPDPPTSTWRPGEKVLVTTEISAQPIPYDLKSGFYLPGVAGASTHLDLGWQADPGR